MNVQKLIEILLELRSASREVSANPSEDALRKLVNKYGMYFSGENYNCIFSHYLAHSINTVFAIHIDIDELNKMIPATCSSLNMKYEPMTEVSNISKPNPPTTCYKIIL